METEFKKGDEVIVKIEGDEYLAVIRRKVPVDEVRYECDVQWGEDELFTRETLPSHLLRLVEE